MDVGNVQNFGPQKADELRETPRVRKDAASAYAKTGGGGGDSVAVSSKARLLHGLREKLDNQPADNARVEQLKEQVQKNGTVDLSAEEIVTGILEGTLFEVI